MPQTHNSPATLKYFDQRFAEFAECRDPPRKNEIALETIASIARFGGAKVCAHPRVAQWLEQLFCGDGRPGSGSATLEHAHVFLKTVMQTPTSQLQRKGGDVTSASQHGGGIAQLITSNTGSRLLDKCVMRVQKLLPATTIRRKDGEQQEDSITFVVADGEKPNFSQQQVAIGRSDDFISQVGRELANLVWQRYPEWLDHRSANHTLRNLWLLAFGVRPVSAATSLNQSSVSAAASSSSSFSSSSMPTSHSDWELTRAMWRVHEMSDKLNHLEQTFFCASALSEIVAKPLLKGMLDVLLVITALRLPEDRFMQLCDKVLRHFNIFQSEEIKNESEQNGKNESEDADNDNENDVVTRLIGQPDVLHLVRLIVQLSPSKLFTRLRRLLLKPLIGCCVTSSDIDNSSTTTPSANEQRLHQLYTPRESGEHALQLATALINRLTRSKPNIAQSQLTNKVVPWAAQLVPRLLSLAGGVNEDRDDGGVPRYCRIIQFVIAIGQTIRHFLLLTQSDGIDSAADAAAACGWTELARSFANQIVFEPIMAVQLQQQQQVGFFDALLCIGPDTHERQQNEGGQQEDAEEAKRESAANQIGSHNNKRPTRVGSLLMQTLLDNDAAAAAASSATTNKNTASITNSSCKPIKLLLNEGFVKLDATTRLVELAEDVSAHRAIEKILRSDAVSQRIKSTFVERLNPITAERLAQHKCASRLIEAAFECGSAADRIRLVQLLMGGDTKTATSGSSGNKLQRHPIGRFVFAKLGLYEYARNRFRWQEKYCASGQSSGQPNESVESGAAASQKRPFNKTTISGITRGENWGAPPNKKSKRKRKHGANI